MTVKRAPSPRKRALRSATTKRMDDQVGLENKPPPLPKKNNIPAAARGSGMVLQQLDDATRLEKNAGANDEAKGSVEEGEICSASTVQRIPRAMKILKMRKAQRSPTRLEQTSRPPHLVATDFMPDSPPISATPVRCPLVGCSMTRLHEGPPTSQTQINVVPPSPAGVYSVIFSPRKVAMDSVDERLQEATEKATAAVKSSGTRKAGSGESSSDLRDVKEGAAGPLIRHEDEASDDGGEAKQEHSPEAQDAAPREDNSNGSRDSRGEVNTDRPNFAQDANRSRKEDRNPKRRRSSSSSISEAEWIVSSKRRRRNSSLALSAILETVHLSNTGLRLYENERDERTIRKAQSHLQTEDFLTPIGLANTTRLFREVKLAREYLQLWEGRPFSVVSMKEWFLVELRDWKKSGGSISGQGGRGDDFGDNFFPTLRLVLVEAPPLLAASCANPVSVEPTRMAKNPHWEPCHSTAIGMDGLHVEEKCFTCLRCGHEAKVCPDNVATGSEEPKELFSEKKARGRRG